MASATTSGTSSRTPSSSRTAHPPPKTAGDGEGHPEAIIGNCTICLRQLVSPDQPKAPIPWNWNKERIECYQNRVRIVPKAKLDSEQLLPTFRRLDIRLQKLSGTGDARNQSRNPPPPPNELPPMCLYCGEKLSELHGISAELELESKVKEFKQIIVDSKNGGRYAWREHQFEKDLKDNPSFERWSSGTSHGFGQQVEAVPGSSSKTIRNDKQGRKIDTEAHGFSFNQEDDDDDDYCEMIDVMDPASSSDSTDSSNDSFELEETEETPNKIRIESSRTVRNTTTTSPRRRNRKKQCDATFQKCDFCNKSFLISHIQEHVREHVGDYVYPCPVAACGQAYTSPSKLETQHFKNNPKCWKVVNPACQCPQNKKDGKMATSCKCALEKICQTCGYNTVSYTELHDHLKSVHETPSQKNFTCPVSECEEAFTVRQSVYAHLDNDHQVVAEVNRPATGSVKVRSQQCIECKKRLPLDKMSEHLISAHGAEEVVTCRLCPLLFSSWRTLVRHLAAHSTHPGGVPCFICNDDTKYHMYNTLSHHYLTAHNVGNLLTCHLCGKTYFNERGLQRHHKLSHTDGGVVSNTGDTAASSSSGRRKQAGRKKPKLVCDVEGCGKVFSGSGHLRHHKVSKHLDPGSEFKCDVEGCGRVFQCWRDLNRHKQNTHFGMGWKKKEKEMCPHCGQYVSQLWSHIKTHTGEMPYQCCYCGQRFRTTTSLSLHVKGHEEQGASFRPRGPTQVSGKRTMHRQQ